LPKKTRFKRTEAVLLLSLWQPGYPTSLTWPPQQGCFGGGGSFVGPVALRHRIAPVLPLSKKKFLPIFLLAKTLCT